MFCLTRENDEMVFFRNDIHTFTLLVLIVERYCPRIRIHRSRVNFTKRIPAGVKDEQAFLSRKAERVLPSEYSLAKRNKKWVSRIVLTSKSLSRTVSEAPWTGPRLRDRWVSHRCSSPRWVIRWAPRRCGLAPALRNAREGQPSRRRRCWKMNAAAVTRFNDYFRVCAGRLAFVVRTCVKVGWRDKGFWRTG